MNNASLLFIHNAWTMAAGNANDFARLRKILTNNKRIDQGIHGACEHIGRRTQGVAR